MYGQFHGLGGFSSVRSATQDNLAVRTRGEIEAPAGTKDLGGWQASAYTPEQQKRLNIDGNGNPVALSSTAADAATGIDVRRPVSWLQNAICLYLFNLKFVFCSCNPHHATFPARAVSFNALAPPCNMVRTSGKPLIIRKLLKT